MRPRKKKTALPCAHDAPRTRPLVALRTTRIAMPGQHHAAADDSADDVRSGQHRALGRPERRRELGQPARYLRRRRAHRQPVGGPCPQSARPARHPIRRRPAEWSAAWRDSGHSVCRYRRRIDVDRRKATAHGVCLLLWAVLLPPLPLSCLRPPKKIPYLSGIVPMRLAKARYIGKRFTTKTAAFAAICSTLGGPPP